ncbi:hypothetical protein [Sphingobacterium sp. BIGb0165]|uniref:hypothetical protein n=1 Tax=Sphingobacterium sp. BIGb0165 TaxID=2940615 RepID=UPI00216935EC|nr:hypothetical protein [Sphingobacterium sp. BIGb0165]MCS4227828.1 putative small secreted protein [Sphingobacterium sp. BIGb0165]
MKRQLSVMSLLLGAAILITSCGNSNESKDGAGDDNETSTGISDVVKGVSNLDNLTDGAKKMEELQTKLKSEKPLSSDELKAFLPESLDGLKRTSYSAGSMYGVSVVSGDATYTVDDQKDIKISIIDGAGETASAIVSLAQMGFMVDSENITDTEVEKTGDFEGKRAKTMDNKGVEGSTPKSSEISYLEKDRYLITLRGNGYSLDELKAFMGKLNVNALK